MPLVFIKCLDASTFPILASSLPNNSSVHRQRRHGVPSHKSWQDKANTKLLCNWGPKACNIQSSAVHKKAGSSRYYQLWAVKMLFSEVIAKTKFQLRIEANFPWNNKSFPAYEAARLWVIHWFRIMPGFKQHCFMVQASSDATHMTLNSLHKYGATKAGRDCWFWVVSRK